jgi:hypothetical protein
MNTIGPGAEIACSASRWWSCPFFTPVGAPKPPTDVNVYTFDLGGPIVKDKTHFFGGYEHTERDLSGLSVITITPANQAALGLSEPAYMPRGLNTEFAIGKVDHQLSAGNRLSVRYMFFDNFITANVGGGLVSVQRANDFADRQHSTGAQLISSIGPTTLNELRVQYATRAQSRVPNALSGTGPAINITGTANIGGPIASVADSGFGFTQNVMQVANSTTLLKGNHAFKAGLDLQWVKDTRVSPQAALYTFPNTAAYLAARSVRRTRLGYASCHRHSACRTSNTTRRSTASSCRTTGACHPTSRSSMACATTSTRRRMAWRTRADRHVGGIPQPKNNFAPRLGRGVVDRQSSARCPGQHRPDVDQTLNAIYETALQNDGTNARASATFTPTQVGAPAFPAVLSTGSGATPNLAWTVDPNFEIARAWQNNLQVERGIGDHYSISVGTSYVRGYNLPVVTNINVINPIGTLDDGRPVFSTAINSSTRADPRYNVINSVQSPGESTYQNLTLQLTRRQYKGIGFDFAYTLGKSEDNAPITGTLSVQGDAGRSDMTNLDRDLGPNILDQRHTLVGSIVATPQFERGGTSGAILNNNVFGVAIQLASGIPVNLRSVGELNNDGTASDRPSGVPRNSLALPSRKNVDFRYSRRFHIQGRMAAEVIAEVKNIFKTVQVSGVTSTVATSALGVPTAPLPTSGDQLTQTGGYEQRQLQIGFKFIF